MEIIKHGDGRKMVIFECRECGCIFRVYEGECGKGRDLSSVAGKEYYLTHGCPECGEICKEGKEDGTAEEE